MGDEQKCAYCGGYIDIDGDMCSSCHYQAEEAYWEEKRRREHFEEQAYKEARREAESGPSGIVTREMAMDGCCPEREGEML